MSEKTAISWTDHTFNPWWGCTKVSAECTNCYAETFDKRIGGEHWGVNAPRRFFSDKHWNEPLKWDAAARAAGERRRVFCASMADVFEERNDLDAARARLWILIAKTPSLDWLLLTKRPEHARFALPWTVDGEPWRNVWLGTTAGTVESLERVAILRRTPAAVRFISCEPILEEITAADWDRTLGPNGTGDVHWLIVGNEKRPTPTAGATGLDPDRAREAAARHHVAFHYKQWVAPNGKVTHLPMLDGKQHAEFPAMTQLARASIPATIMCVTLGRTGPLIRLRAEGVRDLFDDPFAGLAVGDVVLVDATYEDGGETVAATVIGRKPGIVEIQTRGEIDGKPKVVAVRKSRIG